MPSRDSSRRNCISSYMPSLCAHLHNACGSPVHHACAGCVPGLEQAEPTGTEADYRLNLLLYGSPPLGAGRQNYRLLTKEDFPSHIKRAI
ncbi:hypothetical protein RRG08_057657 [Elysia crispata]|uniref:Uncharacterized protein n=1 Tax=Elysia crispata TaxID=231223 RepID=A0AAE1A1J7_9GAST|nr:hypothetical protein RRG08_057657 [Elysia crispata]